MSLSYDLTSKWKGGVTAESSKVGVTSRRRARSRHDARKQTRPPRGYTRVAKRVAILSEGTRVLAYATMRLVSRGTTATSGSTQKAKVGPLS